MTKEVSNGGQRVMIVEDEALVATDLEERLQKLGFDVCGIVDNEREAVLQAGVWRPDLILMDVHLRHGSDGIAAAAQIRKTHAIPVVFVTAHADTATLRRAGLTEPFGYVVKPFEEHSLLATIHMAFYRHRAEARTRMMERWLGTTLHSIGDGVIATDRAGRITFMNSVAATLTGHTAAEAEGRLLHEILVIEQEGTPNLTALLAGAALDGETAIHMEDEHLLRAKAGHTLPVADSISPIRDEQGVITGVVAVFRDRTSRVLADEERRRLERRAQETQRLEALGRLAGSIAHDFNNLLATIVGHVSLSRDAAGSNPELLVSLDRIERSAFRGSELCNQMLAYAGKTRMRLQPLDLGGLAREAADSLQGSIPRHCQVRFNLPDALPTVSGDPAQIRQLLYNLITNASDAVGNQAGTVAIDVSVVNADQAMLAGARAGNNPPPGRFVQVQITDTGAGMTPATLDRIFDPFFTTKQFGRGLGLAAVHGIVQNHAGALFVTSEPDRGTRFRVLFPADKTTVEPARKPPAALREWRGAGKALVVDDEESLRLLVALMLQRLGFEAVCAADGQEAVEIARQEGDTISLIVMDYTMPRLDGLQASLQIRALYPRMPIVIMSGYSEDATVQMFKDHNLEAFMPKPFSFEMLLAQVTRVKAVSNQ